jgi:hypothetical protein
LYALVPGFSGMRVPARFATVVDLGIVVLAAAGAARILGRVSRTAAIVTTAALASIVVVEGRQLMSVDPFPPVQRRLDRAAYEWLRDRPPGAAIELEIAQQNDFHPFTLFYQFNTLLHRHPIVNGYSGWPSVLQEFLGGSPSPFREPGRVADALRALRTIGVRYVLLHWWTYSDGAEPARLMTEIRAARDQLVEERQFQSTFVWTLQDAPPLPAPSPSPLRRIEAGAFTATASAGNDRLPLAFDGDVETRWISGAPQSGAEWIALRFDRPTDVARVRIETSPRGLVDYPRGVRIESIDAQNATRVLFDNRILTPLIDSLAIDDRRAPVDLDLPTNQSVALRIRQTGQTRLWLWGVHELTLFAR